MSALLAIQLLSISAVLSKSTRSVLHESRPSQESLPFGSEFPTVSFRTVSLTCCPRFCLQKVIGVSFNTTMAISDFFLSFLNAWHSLATEYLKFQGERKTSMGHIVYFLPKPALITLRGSNYSDFPFSCTVILPSCQHGMIQLCSGICLQVLRTTPHGDRTTCQLLLPGWFGFSRDFHPLAYVLPLAQKASRSVTRLDAFLDFFYR